MQFLQKLRDRLRPPLPQLREAAEAYDLWAPGYDEQPGNLMMDLDEALFAELLAAVSLRDRVVVDIGCGTGRHWKKILAEAPAELVGYDVSDGMLTELKKKFPEARVQLVTDDALSPVRSGSVDVVLSTLTIAHLTDVRTALEAWIRVLRPGGHLLFTDFHPDLLDRGGKRDFRAGRKHVVIRNQVYPVALLESLAKAAGMVRINYLERLIDERVRHYYLGQQAMDIYHRFQGLPVIYGLHFTKP